MYSFDVFDTLITRCTANPKGIFMLMEEIIKRIGGYPPFIVENFYELRVNAEQLARANSILNGKKEVTLDDIYKSLATTACITIEQQKQLKKIEVETEYNNVLEIKKNILMLKRLKNKGEHIVLISDMYLSKKDIRHMLCKIDDVFNEMPIYVSSDYNMTKLSGELFQLVREKENVDYSNWTHYGDNRYADIESASKLGIQAVYLAAESIKKYEFPQKNLDYQLSIGASRYIRSRLKKTSIAGEIGCTLAGPILYPYIKWVLNESLSRGIKRLYFVARDGWILQQIADTIIKINKYQIKTYYIYGSRKAWRLPAYNGSTEDFDRILRWSNMDEVLCLKDIAKVFQIKSEKLRRYLPKQFKNVNGKQCLLSFQKNNICGQLRENKAFREYLVESQTRKRKLLIQYLQQEIDLSDDKFAFVELSGTGFTQKCLAGIIGTFYGGEIKNFYFKLDSIQNEEQCKFINFYPSSMERSYMLELLCRAPHGQTETYVKRGACIIPVLEQYEGKYIKAYGLEEYQIAVIAYVKHMEYTYNQNDLEYIARVDIVGEYMSIIAENPPVEVAEYFCHMPFSSGGRRNTIVEFAPAITKKQLRRIYFWKDVENLHQVYQGDSLDYALAISDKAEGYKKKCQKYGETYLGNWLKKWNRYLHNCQGQGTEYFCPWEILRGNIVIYGAGKVGKAYVKQANQRRAKCDRLLWVDTNYASLRKMGLDVKAPEKIGEYSYDRVIIAIHNPVIRQEIWDKLRGMGIEAGKIYYG